MGLHQTFYVNHHVFSACMLLIAFGAAQEHRGADDRLGPLFLAVLALADSTLLRVEGLMFAALALAMILGRSQLERRPRVLASLLFLALVAPWHLYLVRLLWSGGFVTGKQFLIMLALATLLVPFFAMSRPAWLARVQQQTDSLAVIVLLAVVVVACAGRFRQMGGNIRTFLVNLYGPAGFLWGATPLFATLAVPFLLLVRRREAAGENDLLLAFPVAATLLALALTVLRVPLVRGYDDSVNRMMFHFLPLALVWISVEISRLRAPLVEHLPAAAEGASSPLPATPWPEGVAEYTQHGG
jgi:hypothetical protein